MDPMKAAQAQADQAIAQARAAEAARLSTND
jgi:hypothetical protein